MPALLTPFIERYIDILLSILGRGRISVHLAALSGFRPPNADPCRRVEWKTIRNTTELTIGIDIGPHMFRTAAATYSAARATGIPGLASALLQHRDRRMTEAHYNRATSHQAAQRYEEMLRAIK